MWSSLRFAVRRQCHGLHETAIFFYCIVHQVANGKRGVFHLSNGAGEESAQTLAIIGSQSEFVSSGWNFLRALVPRGAELEFAYS